MNQHPLQCCKRASACPLVLAALSFMSAVGSARAQTPASAAPTASPTAPEAPGTGDSPRSALARFLEFGHAGNHAEAARLLDLPAADASRGPDLARRLKTVLDRQASLDLDTISPLPEGNAQDGLPSGVEEIASIPGPGSMRSPVRLVRLQDDGGRWAFSRGTVAQIDTWYARLDGQWLQEHLPAPLLRPGPRHILYWQWVALPIVFLCAWLLALPLGRLTRHLLARIAKRTSARWDDELLARLGGPLAMAWTLVLAYLFLPWVGLHQAASDVLYRILRGGLFVVFFWALARAVDVARMLFASARWAKEHPSARSLIPLGTRVGKVLVLIVGVVAMLSELGYPVASLVAGLGIGGLALALAAQKTVENLFGAFSIGADQPIREGDFVRVEDTVGTVEAIGLRSTRIRTLDRTLVSYPNGKLADMRLETYSARDRMRLACTLGVVYGTTVSQMREVLAGLERVLREHPKIWPDAVIVRFASFGDSSLNIDVMAWFQTQDWNEFQVMRQEVFLQFMEVVEKAGSSFAFPTHTVHMVEDRTPPSGESPIASTTSTKRLREER